MFLKRKSDGLQKKIIRDGMRKRFGDAELSYSCGYPVLRLRGSHYRMGLQYGVLVRDEIRGLYAQNGGRKAEVLKTLPWYLRPFSGFFVALVAGYSFLRIPAKYRRELSALSKGSGVPFIDMASTAFGGVVFDAACTSVLAPGERGIIHAQNLDFEPAYLGAFPVIVEYSHPGRLRYMHLGIAGIPGIFHGMNEKGISITINYGDGTYNAGDRGLPMGYKLRDILERAECPDDVERILHEKGHDELGWIITVGYQAGNSGAVFDVFNRETVRNDFRGSKPVFMLNNIFAPERTPDPGLSKKYLPVSMAEGLYHIAREARIKEYMKGKRIDSVDSMIDFLRDYDFYGYEKFTGSMNATIANERTLHTVIFDHSDRAVYLSSAGGYSSLSRIMRYDFDSAELLPYREAVADFDSDAMRGFMEWYCNYQDAVIISTVAEGVSRRFPFVRFREYDFSDIVKSCPPAGEGNPRAIWSLYRIWRRNRNAVKPEDIIRYCDFMTLKYPDLAILYIIRGKIEKFLKRRTNAIRTYETALGCAIISAYDRIHIMNDLAYLCEKTGMTEKAGEYAKLNVQLIESLSERYLPGHKTENILRRMKNYLAG